MNHRQALSARILALLMAASILLGGCAGAASLPAVSAAPAPSPLPSPAPTLPAAPAAPSTGAPSTSAQLDENAVKNAQYTLPDVGAFRLVDGKFEYSYGSGATQSTRAGFSQAAFGDLNGDGQSDAVAAVWVSMGGSGTFVYIVALENGAAGPQQLGADLLGDRVQVRKLAVQNGVITAEVVAFGPKDPKCCPSQQVTRTYGLQSGKLVVLSETMATPVATPR